MKEQIVTYFVVSQFFFSVHILERLNKDLFK